jgi:peroxiredoxin
MTLTASTMLALGTESPNFSLRDTKGRTISRDSFKGAPALLVIFMCNHCPYVKHVQKAMAQMAAEYQAKGVAIVGINSNDIEEFPDDSPEMMAKEAERLCYTFPYLYDESQEVARGFHAACTPDFFLFDGLRRLAYRGQMDDSRPGNDVPVTGADLRKALDCVLAGKPAPAVQKPSMGCNIKWKKGNEPDYFAG